MRPLHIARFLRRTERTQLNRNLLAASVPLLLLSVPARAQVPFEDPAINGAPVDWCLFPAKSCGKPAADKFCELQKLGEATNFTQHPNVGYSGILGSGELCSEQDFGRCDGFAKIVCSTADN